MESPYPFARITVPKAMAGTVGVYLSVGLLVCIYLASWDGYCPLETSSSFVVHSRNFLAFNSPRKQDTACLGWKESSTCMCLCVYKM